MQHVPSYFVKQTNATEGANKVKLQFRGKECDAVINIHGNSSRINKGWASFAEQNALHVGDACVFELINTEDALIRVTIFKCSINHYMQTMFFFKDAQSKRRRCANHVATCESNFSNLKGGFYVLIHMYIYWIVYLDPYICCVSKLSTVLVLTMNYLALI